MPVMNYDEMLGQKTTYKYRGQEFVTENDVTSSNILIYETKPFRPEVYGLNGDSYSVRSNQHDDVQKAIVRFPDNYNNENYSVVLKFSGAGGSGVNDNQIFEDSMHLNNTDNILVSVGSSKLLFGNECLRRSMGDNYPPKYFDVRGFSLGCKSAVFSQASFINEQSIEGNYVESQNAVLCDPGSWENEGQIFSSSVEAYEGALSQLPQNNLEEIIKMVNKGHSDESIRIVYSNLDVLPSELVTYYAYKQNQPTVSVIAGTGITDLHGENGVTDAWKTRPDLSVLGACTDETVVYKFDDYNHQEVNQYVDLLFKDENCQITEEIFYEIIGNENFTEMGVFNKDTGVYDVYNQNDLLDENGELNQEVISELYDSIYLSGSDDTVSVDYNFVNSEVEKMRDFIKRTDILTLNKVDIETGGMLTFEVANQYFNDYAGTSKNFLLELNRSYNAILQMTDAISNLDESMASSIDLDAYISSLPSFNYLMNTDLTSVDEFYREYSMSDLLDFSISKDVKLTTDMLIDVLSDRHIMKASLIEDIMDTTRIMNGLNDFIENSRETLTGEAFDLMRVKLDEYSEICDNKIRYAQTLMDMMHDAFMSLLEYMEDYDLLDTSMLPEVESQISSVRTQINNLEQELASLQHMHGRPIYGEDKDGNPIVIGHIDNSAQMASVSAQIESLEILLAELTALKNKLDGLPAQDNAAAGMITDVGLASQTVDTVRL